MDTLLPPDQVPRPTPDHTPDPIPDHAARTAELRARITARLTYDVGKTPATAGARDWFTATALAVRDEIVDHWFDSTRRTYESGAKRVYYLSLEFLIGRLLFDALGNLGITEALRDALAAEGVDLDRLAEEEPDAALGNGGLGRLAACFMESMATLGVAAYGYGIRYEHGLFRQVIQDGIQQEHPEDWLQFGHPWEFERPEVAYPIGFGGTVAPQTDAAGRTAYAWHPAEHVSAVAYDTPVIGAATGGPAINAAPTPGATGATPARHHANTLRLWSARAVTPLHLETFNRGDHVGAMHDRVRREAVSRVLYPGDESDAGQELRLRQEFFFASASLQDLLRRHLDQFGTLANLHDKVAIQLNDTHPAIAVIELMRLLMDVHGIPWDDAWATTVASVAYTNHTLLPEALETWPVSLMERLLPRHMQIIYLLNGRHLEHVRSRPGTDDALLAALSLIDERHGRRVRMGHLAFLGSHAVNGVSALHTALIGHTVFGDMNGAYPGRIQNKTNGITVRRWLHRANPRLSRLVADTIGPRVLADADALADLAAHAADPALQAAFAAQRRHAKDRLAAMVADRTGIAVDPAALFDVHVKRMHEYKRQLLNILHAVAQYDAIRAQPTRDWVPRVKILAGKAAPGYHMAKLVVRLAHDVGHVVNNDPAVAGRLKLVFLPNYNVSLAERIIPAADLSEQISTAGMEASGTGNMKLALNGALTVGTLDGANVEIRDRVGAANIFIFGLTAEGVVARRAQGLNVHDAARAIPALHQALEAIRNGSFSPGEPGRYRALVDGLLDHDRFMVVPDFESYAAAQDAVDRLWTNPAAWWQTAVTNTASVGWFSSDRTIREYATEIWNAPLGT